MKVRPVLTLALLILCCSVAQAADSTSETPQEPVSFPASYKVMTVSNGGTITGVVKFSGDVPAMKQLEISKNPEVCAKTDKFEEHLMVGEGNVLKNAFVYLVDISQGVDFPKKNAAGKRMTYEIDQNGCQFIPHVNVVPVGKKLTMKNSDGILHNIHLFSKKGYNQAQPKTRRKLRIAAAKKPEGPIPIRCDIHGWMNGWLIYINHPYYAVTNEKGEYKIENVPPGTYKLAWWQEACGTNKEMPASVTVAAGGTVKQDFTVTLRKKK
jgi:plastocyanin